ncbi:GNAT family N-acetyltransferase [Bifidobacterium canis]|uniref:GNAT family N-acetyltransferase n=1 Tax=Bifidobacterium canis TaxID=2610880 RepID=A0A7K1J670_9BIFI|nr:GNAT family N-acetyltransferase [Bifidobacterium canis]MUH60029.1 GNAT family N-acetyltransferase [Bifidobacterium canis]
MSGDVVLREAREEDYPFILRVNEENVAVLSPMDEAHLRKLDEGALRTFIAEVDSAPAAFAIVMRDGFDAYDSQNYHWFAQRYPQFVYVDRIAIDAPYRGRGVGRAIYDAVFDLARETESPVVAAEIDTIPYNEPSLKFHESMGFHEVGTQFVSANGVQVSLQIAPVQH